MLLKLALLASVVALPLAATQADAAPTLGFYSLSATGSGSLNGVAFNDAVFSFAMIGDADAVNSTAYGSEINPLLNAIATIGVLNARVTFSISTRLGTFQNGNTNGIYFSRTDGTGDLFDFYTPMAIDLSNSFDTVTGTNVSALNQFRDVPTTGGLLTFYQSSSVQFQGVVNERAAVPQPAVPEPATWAMMVAGFGLVGGAMRRRKISVAFG